MSPEYSFSFLETPVVEEDDSEDLRTNLHVVPCCGNCKYLWYIDKQERRRGYCRLAYAGVSLKTIDKKLAPTLFRKTHVTLLCDKHKDASALQVNNIPDVK